MSPTMAHTDTKIQQMIGMFRQTPAGGKRRISLRALIQTALFAVMGFRWAVHTSPLMDRPQEKSSTAMHLLAGVLVKGAPLMTLHRRDRYGNSG